MFNIFNFLNKKPNTLNDSEKREQLSIFGIWNSPTGIRPILEKQATGFSACKKCKGYGTWGMPLCGAVYICQKCKGTGKR